MALIALMRIGSHLNSYRYLNGSVSDVRVYDRGITPEEALVLYEMTNPILNTKIKQTKDCLYIKGQIQET